ncbi:MAG: M13-type metalloendopeptidase, partial [Candidatus Ornithomonoglobus sp.]
MGKIGSASIITDDYYLQDIHSTNRVRVNACVTTLDYFYDLYDVKEGDQMYVAARGQTETLVKAYRTGA